jgi:hypothetical protein
MVTTPVLYDGVLEGTVSALPLAGGAAREVVRRALAADFGSDGSEFCLVTRLGSNQFQLESGFTSLAWASDGREVWYSTFDSGESEILAVTLEGKVRPLARYAGRLELTDVDPSGRALAIVSSHVRQAFGRARGAREDMDLTWLDAQTPQSLRRDGSHVVLARASDWEMSKQVSLYLRPLTGEPATRIGTGALWANISADGRSLVTLATGPNGEPGVRVIPTGAGAPRWYGLAGPAVNTDAAWFHPDGRSVYLGEEVTNTVSRLDLETGVLTHGIVPGRVGFSYGLSPFSPDGRRMLFEDMEGVEWDESPFIYEVFEGDGAKPAPAKGILRTEVAAGWSDDSREVYLYDRNTIPANVVRWNPITGARRPFLRIAPPDASGVWGISNLVISPSGDAYVYSVLRELSDVYLINGLQ